MTSGTGPFERIVRPIHWRYLGLLARCSNIPARHYVRWRLASIWATGMKPGDRILEMCCGRGETTRVIAEVVGSRSKVDAIDTWPEAIEIARRQSRLPYIEFLVRDASDTGFRSGTFDIVVIPHALHNMERDRWMTVLREARRVLREGGSVAIVEVDWPRSPLTRLYLCLWWWYWLPWRFQLPTRRDFLRRGVAVEVREAGFRNVTERRLYSGAVLVVKAEKLTAGAV